MWAKGVFETIGKSKVKIPEKVLEILESRDQRKENKIEGKNKRIILVIPPMGPRIEGTLRNILELSCIVVIWSHWNLKACIHLRKGIRQGGYEEELQIFGRYRRRD